MAETTLSIVNAALWKLGERELTSLAEDTPQGRVANAVYEQAFRYIYTKRAWAACREQESLTKDGTWSSTNSERYPYRYAIPATLVSILRVFTNDEEQYYNWKRRGEYIYTDIDPIILEYTKDVTADSRIDPALAQVLQCYLAYILAPRLTKEEETAGRMYQEYQQALREAVVADARQQGPHFYGPNQPAYGDYYEDHPDGWVER